MLSYRHAFHAGNHADVLKHAIVTHLLDYLGQKDKPFWYIDTHAGAGLYALDRGYAVVRSGDAVVRNPSQVAPGDALRIRVAGGELTASAE